MLSFLYVYSDHSILECYNLFSGVELSMRSFFVILRFLIVDYFEVRRGCEISRSKRVLEVLLSEFCQICLLCSFRYLICGVLLMFRPGGMMSLFLYC